MQCYFTFRDYTACLVGRIYFLSDDEIKVTSDDKKSELALALRPWMSFGYGDPRNFPEEALEYESTLLVFFEEPPEKGEPDKIAFLELK